MRKVKCKNCGKQGTNEIFYKVVNKGKNEYYCSKEEYDNLQKDKALKSKLLKYIALEIMNYKEGQILPPILLKKVNELNQFYDLEVIKETFNKCEEILKYCMSLENKFNSDFAKISYMMSIIKNSINDVYKEHMLKQKREKESQKENTSIDLELFNESTNVKIINNKIKDISDFLD